MKIRKLFKRAAAFALAAVTALSAVPATTAFAAGDIGTISFTHTYDGAGNAIRYNSSANIGGHTAGGTGEYKYRMYVDGETAFCLQPGVPLKTGNTLAKASSNAWNALSADQKKAVGLALLYGYQGNSGNLSGSDDEKWLATQTLVWEFVTGCRQAASPYSQTSTAVYSLHFGSNYANSGARAAYDQIVSFMIRHSTIPSFMSAGKKDITKELAYNVLDSEPVYFDVEQENSEEESGVTIVKVERSNIAQKGKITVGKSGEVFSRVSGNKGLYQPIFAVDNLEGAVYEITAAEDIITTDGTVRAEKGEVVDTLTTGEDGTAESKELYLGKYEVKEVTAPYGMVLSDEAHAVELVYAGQEIEVTETGTEFYNERQRVEINVIKSLEVDEAYGVGNNGEIKDVTFGLYAAEELTAADGTTIPADGLIEVIFLDENGHGKAVSDLPIGSYYVQEISTNAAYLVSDEKYPVDFEYAGQETAVVTITANEGEAIENELIYGSVSGRKSNEDGEDLGGAFIGIFQTGTTEYTKENAIATATSEDDGSFSFGEVPYGTWVIREIESPKGYVLSEEEISVTIGEVDEVVEVELVNYFITGNIALTKVDKDYPDNKLTGAVFEVYSDTRRDVYNGCFLSCIFKYNRILFIADKISGICADFLHIVAAHR